MLDGGYEVEVDIVKQNVDEAEVISLYFPLIHKTLLVDTRTNETTGPLVCVVEMVSSSHERMRSLRRLRPQFARPESITMIPWTRRVDSLASLGVWAHVEGRLEAAGDASALEAANACLEDLRAYEHREFRRAVTGEQYQTLWGRLGLGDAAPGR